MTDLHWRDCSETTQNMFIDWTIQHLVNRAGQTGMTPPGISDWASEVATRRLTLGRDKYQSHIFGFQGDPLLHLIEEQFDALFYTFILWRRDEEENGGLDAPRIIPLIRGQVAALVESFSMLSDWERVSETSAWIACGKDAGEIRSPQTMLHLVMDRKQDIEVRRDTFLSLEALIERELY